MTEIQAGKAAVVSVILALVLALSGCGCSHSRWSEASCTEPARCLGCGRPEGLPAGHSWLDADCTSPQICAVCGSTKGENKGHSWNEATTQTPKTCRKCGATEGEALAAQEERPTWKQTYFDVCALAAEILVEFEPEFSFDSTEDILYISIAAPQGTTLSIVQQPESLSEYWTELSQQMCELGDKVHDAFLGAGYGTDCCIMLLGDADEGQVLLASFNDFIRYDCLSQ